MQDHNPMFEILPIRHDMRNKVADFIAENWGVPIIVTKGRIHTVEDVQGYAVIVNEEVKSLITYRIEKDECEIVSLDSLIENQGIGTRLIERVVETAKQYQCKRVWLITTNDNTKSIGIFIRKAKPNDYKVLTEISFKAKRYWNYPEECYEIWKDELTISEEYIKNNTVYVAEHDERIVGYYSIVQVNEDFWAGRVFVMKGFWLEQR